MSGPKNNWRKLDNAAKIFPATSSKSDVRVFRFYCELESAVDGELLSKALEKTVEKYPLLLSVMRKGMFWYYLEKSDRKPVVKEEEKPPCTNLYFQDKKSLLFEVSYYKNRINLEIFHALMDGTGAIQFIRELVKNYLVLAHREENLPDIALTEENQTRQDFESDGFAKYYSKESKGRKEKSRRTYQLNGAKAGYGNLQVMEATLSTSELLSKSREYGVSMTVLLTAVFLCAIEKEMTERQKSNPVALMVPVNLRRFFPSASMLNFFGWIEPFYQFGADPAVLEDVIASVSRYFNEELTKERLGTRMGNLVRLEYNPFLRVTPLELKNLGMMLGAKMAKKNVTAIFSNMGSISMPCEYVPYIRRFGVFISTPKIELCMCSFEDTVTLSFTSAYQNPNIHRNFFGILKEIGLKADMITPDFPTQKEAGYPDIRFFQWTTFLCITMAVLGIMANVLLTPGIWWSIASLAAIFMIWVSLAVGFFKRHNLLKNALWQIFLINGGCILWDRLMGWQGWSVNYVLPISSLVITGFMVAAARASRLKVQEYMIYFLASGMIGLLPAALLAAKVVGVALPSVLCSGFSFLFLTMLVIFKWNDLVQELSKKLHL